MAELKTVIKLQVQAGKANPAPPIGPALGQHGINIQEFCTQFNDATKDKMGNLIPVEISVFDDNSFKIAYKTPPASDLIKKAAGVKKGSGVPHTDKVGKMTMDQCREIAETKLDDLNAHDVEAGANAVAGTARSMGITVEGK